MKNSYDMLLIGDFTREGDAGLRVAGEIRTYYDMGCSVGIRHLSNGIPTAKISPDIQLQVRKGLAEIVSTGDRIAAKLTIVYNLGIITENTASLRNLTSENVIIVHDEIPDLRQMGLWHRLAIGKVTWAPTNRWVRAKLEALEMPVPMLREDWRPVARSVQKFGTNLKRDRVPVYGRISLPGPSQWVKDTAVIENTFNCNQMYGVRLMGAPTPKVLEVIESSRQWKIFEPGDITVERLVDMLDVFIYFPRTMAATLPDAAIVAAMASGKIVILPPELEPHFGPGAVYTLPGEARQIADELLADGSEAERDKICARAVECSDIYFSEGAHKGRVAEFIDTSNRPKPSKSRVTGTSKSVLFVPSNGVGMGHVNRLIAVARRLDNKFSPIFASMAKSLRPIEAFGYRAEYLPSRADTGTNADRWDEWFGYELRNIVERYNPDAVVFDGNNPTPGLINAVLSEGRSKLIWMRRGMISSKPSPFLDNVQFMDLTIEPGDVSAGEDTGPLAHRRGEALQVRPITLLDRTELLDRDVARKKLGLSLDRPAVLVQLGAGANRNLAVITDEVMDYLSKIESLQIVLAEWEGSSASYRHYPGVKRLRGHPISGFFNAFDFSIAAAGYNTFHDVLSSGLPTIFVANRHPEMDNQAKRAEFAQNNSAGFDVPEDRLYQIEPICEALLREEVREIISENCLTLSMENGAQEAADAIAMLATQ